MHSASSIGVPAAVVLVLFHLLTGPAALAQDTCSQLAYNLRVARGGWLDTSNNRQLCAENPSYCRQRQAELDPIAAQIESKMRQLNCSGGGSARAPSAPSFVPPSGNSRAAGIGALLGLGFGIIGSMSSGNSSSSDDDDDDRPSTTYAPSPPPAPSLPPPLYVAPPSFVSGGNPWSTSGSGAAGTSNPWATSGGAAQVSQDQVATSQPNPWGAAPGSSGTTALPQQTATRENSSSNPWATVPDRTVSPWKSFDLTGPVRKADECVSSMYSSTNGGPNGSVTLMVRNLCPYVVYATIADDCGKTSEFIVPGQELEFSALASAVPLEKLSNPWASTPRACAASGRQLSAIAAGR